ncbi:MAG TPA: STAS domain-containing protein [Burkholderiales bacterium]|nr:STAS domain-containing protein [Burkholderiales bacterium]
MPKSETTHRVAATLTLATATEALAAAFAALSQSVTIFDFFAVKELDSAALAYILVCQREAIRLGKSLQCTNVPENLKNLAALYGVATYIPI